MPIWGDNPLNPPARLADAVVVSTATAETSTVTEDRRGPFNGLRQGEADRRIERFAEPGSFSDVPAADRRRSRRSAHDVAGWLGPRTGRAGSGRHVRVTDLSLHGAGFETDRPLDEKAAHWFMVTNGALRLSCRLRVVKCEETDAGYTVGGEFF